MSNKYDANEHIKVLAEINTLMLMQMELDVHLNHGR